MGLSFNMNIVLQYLYNLHEVAEKNNDGQFADFVEVMLEEQVIYYLALQCFVLQFSFSMTCDEGILT